MIRIDASGEKPIYEQIIDAVKENVLKGYWNAGDAIPSVRKLAFDLKITPNTAAKAYQELERQKVIVTIRGKGTFIARHVPKKPDEEREARVRGMMKNQIMELVYMGYSREQVLETAAELYEELKAQPDAE
ncbi:MAG: GntR family transcriptional regulator [Lachnospiraceae bacterium]|nr:GntR family transcriptional regulator [Lachnospiraceae bacterium]